MACRRCNLNVCVASIDSTDQKIIDTLTRDARQSASQVGRLVGLSPPAAKRRIDRLEQIGLIRGYTLLVDHRMAGDQIEAFVELRFAPGTQVADVDTAVTDLPEVI